MKKGIHPNYQIITANCTCGNIIEIFSTLKEQKLNLDVCNQCHPFYTGKQRDVSTRGRVDRFNKRFSLVNKNK
ncbi:50S ribosomal protein L31 [Pantoea sp. SoEX]|uniref:50S ribosomal protein L31 n=1 Tax=Pantoea sp. SoEX TaxID=2576763 RepID=UPI0013570E20|nr:50S ribosomal protein L31 [Pantoea sp. SoEX]MXP51450.1 50S ribosomal protein L31 [Pantoea sp. SoEX]